jgi:hypothetical protein
MINIAILLEEKKRPYNVEELTRERSGIYSPGMR